MKGSMERIKTGLKPERAAALLKEYLSDSRKRIFVYTLAGVLLLALILGVSLFLKSRGDGAKTPGAISESDKRSAPGLTYLPDTEREKDGRDGDPQTSLRDPFTGAVVLKGIIKGGEKDFAIIESGKIAYVVGAGDSVAGGWTVKGIEKDSVVLKAGKQELRLGFNGRLKAGPQTNAAGAGTTSGENKKAEDNQTGPGGGNAAN